MNEQEMTGVEAATSKMEAVQRENGSSQGWRSQVLPRFIPSPSRPPSPWVVVTVTFVVMNLRPPCALPLVSLPFLSTVMARF